MAARAESGLIKNSELGVEYRSSVWVFNDSRAPADESRRNHRYASNHFPAPLVVCLYVGVRSIGGCASQSATQEKSSRANEDTDPGSTA
jgi:hypothetical protein